MLNLLHVGCGGSRLKDLPAFFNDGQWTELRYDINPDVQPDIIGTLQDMSIVEDDVIDAVYSSHNIEHVWAYEVPRVLAEFLRVLTPDGFAVVLCPDMQAVCQAVVAGDLEQTLYVSPAGPITAMDIMYGHQLSIQQGNEFMGHRTGFTSASLAKHMITSGFKAVAVAADRVYGLHAIAFKTSPTPTRMEAVVSNLMPVIDGEVSVQIYAANQG